MRLVRRAAVAVAAGALISGVAVYGSATAGESPPAGTPATESADETGTAQASTLRAAAATSGRFIGTAVNDSLLNNPTYAAIAGGEFSSVTAENVMKWESIQPSEGQFNWAAADRLARFAEQHNQDLYGHTLVWHSQLPGWVENGNHSAQRLRGIITDHINAVAGRYASDVDRWDVVNEAFNEDGTFRNSVFYRTLGESYIADSFRAARAAAPGAKLFINDYNTDGINAKSDGMYRLVQSLLNQGVPIDGVGFQSHMILGQMPSTYQANLERFAALGLEVVITELDIRMNTPSDSNRLEQQAQQYSQVTQACLNVSRCSGITVWGISDRDSWIPDVFPGEGAANLYDDNYQPKPAYHAMLRTLGGGDPTDPSDPTDPADPSDPSDPADPTNPGQGCTATYQTNFWNAGSVVEVRVTSAAALSGWTVTWTLPSGTVTNSWNAQVSQSGTAATATNLGYNGAVPAGGTLAFGFQTDSGNPYPPPTVRLNGSACATS
jgi:endo-1,4-beta-xylanase